MPSFDGLAGATNKTDALYTQLAAIARRLRRSGAQPFYTTRDVARFFGVSGPSVARVYKRLELDGLLLILRGSMTLLRGHKLQPRQPVMGVVAIPFEPYTYCRWTDWRLFFTHMTAALRERHFAVDLMLIPNLNPTSRTFADTLLSHHPDYVLCFGFVPTALPSMLGLRDGGIQVISVGLEPHNQSIPQYRFRWDRALARAAGRWRASGVEDITSIVQEQDYPWARDVLTRAGMRVRLAAPGRMSHEEYLLNLSRDSTHAVFSGVEDWFAQLSNTRPDVVINLLRHHRVMTLHRLSLHHHHLAGIHLDVVSLDWPNVAQRIAEDILNKTLPKPDRPATIHARWWHDVPAGDFANEF